jgi:hypothetical protein
MFMATKKKTIKNTSKVQTAFRFSSKLIGALKKQAQKENRSLNNYVETILSQKVFNVPNAETIEAIQEARKKKNIERIDNVDDFLNSI